MRLFLLFAALAVFLSPSVCAQATVNAAGVTFVDSASGTNATTITLGQSVTWIAGPLLHTVTNGTGNTDPNAGTLFDAPLDPNNPTFTYIPTQVGTILYFCRFHELFSMDGTISVLPAAPVVDYPGTNEDLVLATGVNGPASSGPANDIKQVSANDTLSVQFSSPAGALAGSPFLILAEGFMTGSAPVGPLPSIHVSLTGFVIVVDGISPVVPGFQPQLPTGGVSLDFIVPPGMSGISVLFQGFAFVPSVANGFFAATDAHEIQIQ